MKNIVAFILGILLLAIPPAFARHRGNPTPVTPPGNIQVASGCAPVSLSDFTGATLYVNAGGNDANPGTIGSPVQHIGRAALLANPLGRDTIALQDSGGAFPGYPSDFSFGGGGGLPGLQIQWPAFTRITAAAGSSPVFSGWFRLKDVGKLLVDNINFFGHSLGTADPFLSVESDASPDSSNVVIYHSTFASDTVPTMLGWTAGQWQSNARAVAIQFVASITARETQCMTANGNTVTGVGSGIAGVGPKVSINNSNANHVGIFNNIVNYIPDDGITWAGSHIEISFNTVTNHFYVGDGNHNDGIQHQSCNNPSPPFYCVDTDIIINGNYSNELTVPAATLPLYQQCVGDGSQGIDSFDDQVDNAQIINNVVSDCSTNGQIAFYSLTNSLIANNTAIKYVQSGNSGGGCSILAGAHAGPNSSNDIMRNNICTNITIDGGTDVVTQGITIDHNLCLVGCHINWTVSGTPFNISAPGSYAANSGATNVIIAGANTTVINAFDISVPTYDFNPLIPTSPAIGTGTVTGAPTYPNYPTYTPRTAPVNEGALGPGP